MYIYSCTYIMHGYLVSLLTFLLLCTVQITAEPDLKNCISAFFFRFQEAFSIAFALLYICILYDFLNGNHRNMS